MATSVSFHGNVEDRSKAPEVTVLVWHDYACITLKRGGDSVDFYISPQEGETIDSVVGRITRQFGTPRINYVK